MSAKGKKRKDAKTAGISVVVVRPAVPDSHVLEQVYQILAASKTAS